MLHLTVACLLITITQYCISISKGLEWKDGIVEKLIVKII